MSRTICGQLEAVVWCALVSVAVKVVLVNGSCFLFAGLSPLAENEQTNNNSNHKYSTNSSSNDPLQAVIPV
jgi:hypothetical protein